MEPWAMPIRMAPSGVAAWSIYDARSSTLEVKRRGDGSRNTGTPPSSAIWTAPGCVCRVTFEGKLHSNKTIPEPVFAEVVVVSRHKMSSDTLERAHVFNRARQGLLRHLLFFIDIAGDKHRRCTRLDRRLPKRANHGL